MIFRNNRLETSYSQLDTFLSCPYKWKLKYIDGIIVEGQSKHLDYGLTIHEVLEEYFNSIKNGNKLSKVELCNIYKDKFSVKNIAFDDFGEVADYYSAGHMMIDRLYEPLNEFEELLSNAEIVGVEEPFEVVIDIPNYEFDIEVKDGIIETKSFERVIIVGYIDLILKTDKGYIIIDHKSGNKLYKKDKLEHNLQFPIYALAILQKFKEIPAECYYNFTKLGDFQQVFIDEARLEEAERIIKGIFREMKKRNQPPKPCPLCFWCGYGKHNSKLCKFSSVWKPKKKED